MNEKDFQKIKERITKECEEILEEYRRRAKKEESWQGKLMAKNFAYGSFMGIRRCLTAFNFKIDWDEREEFIEIIEKYDKIVSEE